jgi:hypothetical protein
VDNYRNIGITVKSPAVKTRYRLISSIEAEHSERGVTYQFCQDLIYKSLQCSKPIGITFFARNLVTTESWWLMIPISGVSLRS